MQMRHDTAPPQPGDLPEELYLGSGGPSAQRGTVPRPRAQVRLHARNTVLEFADGGVVTLPVGVGDLARDVLRHDPPTPSELERGIDLVEDALAAARLPKAERGTLVTSAPALRALPGLEAPEALLPLAAVEALFQRLASRALGTPVALAELPEGREIAAVLLVLRECMHHLGFEHVGTMPS
ncbi:hypothetical protein GCM10028796_02010 [Ramlibacter monticola]